MGAPAISGWCMMKVGIVSTGSADTIATWSGIPYHVAAALRDAGIDVSSVDAGPAPWPRLRYWTARVAHLRGRANRSDLYPSVLAAYARSVERQIAASSVDIVLGMSALALADLRVHVPVTLWADATFAGLSGSYPEFIGLPRQQEWLGRAADATAMHRCAAVFFASRWAADSAATEVRLPRERIIVAPFGASLLHPPRSARVSDAIRARDGRRCRLITIGVDWARKRADVAVQTVTMLRQKGLDATLLVVGMTPQHGKLPAGVECVPYIDKTTPAGAAFIERALLASDFHLLPSSAECFGIAVAEAAAYGVPTLASAVGGLSEAVVDGTSGWLLDDSASATDYADVIAREFANREGYLRIAEDARRDYERRLNWPASVRTVIHTFKRILG